MVLCNLFFQINKNKTYFNILINNLYVKIPCKYTFNKCTLVESETNARMHLVVIGR